MQSLLFQVSEFYSVAKELFTKSPPAELHAQVGWSYALAVAAVRPGCALQAALCSKLA
jgi:hypothetical protein